jgi:hypothetical protein
VQALQTANPPRRLERFAVRSGERTIFVPVEEVDWIEAFQNYVRLHAAPGHASTPRAHEHHRGRTYGDRIRRALTNPFWSINRPVRRPANLSRPASVKGPLLR